MAIVRTAGTEIIRSAAFSVVDDTETVLIYGEQHHIYTVLSICCNASTINGDFYLRCFLESWDSKSGSQQTQYIFNQKFAEDETFVWNDKFSFTGMNPTGVSGALGNAAYQNALADQGGSTAHQLKCSTTHSSDDIDILITYIDQNNA